MSLFDGLRRALSRGRRNDAPSRLTPEERAALELAGYDDIGKRTRTGSDPADGVAPGSVDSAQAWWMRDD